MSQPETILRSAIIDALRAMGIWCSANNIDRRSGRHAGLGIGSPDIIAIVPVPCIVKTGPGAKARSIGRLVGLECKNEVKPAPWTKEQRAWGRDLVSRGGFYAVVHTIDEAVIAIQAARAGETVEVAA